VSRPYVVKLIDSGKLPARMVGTRRRVALADLVKFDEADRKSRRAALDEIARLDQELEL
jgi:excisionase family DNA binding protein